MNFHRSRFLRRSLTLPLSPFLHEPHLWEQKPARCYSWRPGRRSHGAPQPYQSLLWLNHLPHFALGLHFSTLTASLPYSFPASGLCLLNTPLSPKNIVLPGVSTSSQSFCCFQHLRPFCYGQSEASSCSQILYAWQSFSVPLVFSFVFAPKGFGTYFLEVQRDILKIRDHWNGIQHWLGVQYEYKSHICLDNYFAYITNHLITTNSWKKINS